MWCFSWLSVGWKHSYDILIYIVNYLEISKDFIRNVANWSVGNLAFGFSVNY